MFDTVWQGFVQGWPAVMEHPGLSIAMAAIGAIAGFTFRAWIDRRELNVARKEVAMADRQKSFVEKHFIEMSTKYTDLKLKVSSGATSADLRESVNSLGYSISTVVMAADLGKMIPPIKPDDQ
jgi:hypothetical protein